MQTLKTVFKKKKNYVTELHENNNDDSDFKHACMIAVFLLIRLLYLFIHSLNHLFRSIQTLMMLTDLINFIVVPSSIACCLPNSPLKLIFSQCKSFINFHFFFKNNMF